MSENEMNPHESLRDVPIDADRFAWPQASLDPVERMRVVAASLPYCAVRETVFDAGFDRVWDFIADLENSTPRFEGTVSSVRILERDADRLRLRSRMIMGLSTEFDVVLRRGWCLMQARGGQIGMAARPENDSQTRFIHFEGSPRFGRILRPYFRWNIGGDFRKIAAILE
jgi:hypothetical protein